jgi:hypothetical protein
LQAFFRFCRLPVSEEIIALRLSAVGCRKEMGKPLLDIFSGGLSQRESIVTAK